MIEDEKFLRNMAHEFEEGFKSGDVDRIMRFYADTYVDVNLRNPVQTKAERREYYAQFMARPGIHVHVQPDEGVSLAIGAKGKTAHRTEDNAVPASDRTFLRVDFLIFLVPGHHRKRFQRQLKATIRLLNGRQGQSILALIGAKQTDPPLGRAGVALRQRSGGGRRPHR